MENTLKSGKCPKCGANEIYTTHGQLKRGERMQLVVSSWKWFSLDVYICITCGYFEEHIDEKDIKDEKIIEKIKETWNKV